MQIIAVFSKSPYLFRRKIAEVTDPVDLGSGRASLLRKLRLLFHAAKHLAQNLFEGLIRETLISRLFRFIIG